MKEKEKYGIENGQLLGWKGISRLVGEKQQKQKIFIHKTLQFSSTKLSSQKKQKKNCRKLSKKCDSFISLSFFIPKPNFAFNPNNKTIFHPHPSIHEAYDLKKLYHFLKALVLNALHI